MQIGKIVGVLRRRQTAAGYAFLELTFGHFIPRYCFVERLARFVFLSIGQIFRPSLSRGYLDEGGHLIRCAFVATPLRRRFARRLPGASRASAGPSDPQSRGRRRRSQPSLDCHARLSRLAVKWKSGSGACSRTSDLRVMWRKPHAPPTSCPPRTGRHCAAGRGPDLGVHRPAAPRSPPPAPTPAPQPGRAPSLPRKRLGGE